MEQYMLFEPSMNLLAPADQATSFHLLKSVPYWGICRYEVSALFRELFQQNYYRYASYFAYTYREKAHLFTCSEQKTSIIMEQTFYYEGENLSDCMVPATEQDYDYIDSWFEEHPNTSAVPFPEWI